MAKDAARREESVGDTASALRFRSSSGFCSTRFRDGLIGDADLFWLNTSPLVILPPTVTRFSFLSPSQYGPIGPLAFDSGVLGVVPTGSDKFPNCGAGVGGRMFIEFVDLTEIFADLG